MTERQRQSSASNEHSCPAPPITLVRHVPHTCSDELYEVSGKHVKIYIPFGKPNND